METFVHCAPDVSRAPGSQRWYGGTAPSFLGVFHLVPLFPTRANLFLGESAHPVQGHRASKETNSRAQTLPKREQCLVEQTKIREGVEKRAGLR